MTKLIKEAKRLQKLAGLNEIIKVQSPAKGIADFLNNHDEEVEDKIIIPNAEFYDIEGEITYDKWEKTNPYYHDKPDDEVDIAESSIDGERGYIGVIVSFEPFDEEYIEDADYSNEHPITIGSRTVYVNTYYY